MKELNKKRAVIKKDGKGFTLAATVFVMLALSAVGIGLTSSVSTVSAGSLKTYQAQQAFYIAEGGLQYILANDFRGDTNFSDNTAPTPAPYASGALDFSDGQFWVEYSSVTPTSVSVKVTAKVGESVRAIQQQVAQAVPLSYAFAGTNNLVLEGDGILNGDVSAGGSVNVNNGFVVNGTIYEDNDIDLPTVDLATYIAMTNETDTNGTLNVSGNYSHNIYAEGNVNIGNNASVTGIIVSDGNISIGKNVSINGALIAAGNITSNELEDADFTWQYGSNGQVLPLLAAEGNISLKAKDSGHTPTTATITGMLISEGNINLTTIQDSSIVLNGFMFAHGTSNSNGASGDGQVEINYDSSLADEIAKNNLALSSWQEV